MRTTLLMSVALAPLAYAQSAAAQDEGSTQLDVIEIQGRKDGGAIAFDGSGVKPVEGYVPAATTTGTKTDTPVILIPQSVGVVGRQQMEDLGAQKTDEATRYSAGVFSQPFGDDTDTNWFYIRGFDATQTGVYRDGMQLYSYAFGNFYQDSYLLERVEVLRGASASLYGGGNVGGIINYVSKRPLDADFNQVEVGIDNYPTAYTAFDVNKTIPNDLITKGDPLPPVWKYRVTGKFEGGDGYAKHEDGIRGVIQGAATYAPDAGTDVTVYANYTHADQNHGSGDFLPYYGAVKDAKSEDGTINLGKIGRRTNFSDPDIDDHDRRQAMVGYEFNHDLNDMWTVNTKARFAYSHLEESQLYPFGYGFAPVPAAGNVLLSRINFAHDTESYSFTTDNNLVGRFSTGGIDHTLLLGLDYKFYGIDEVQGSSTGTSVTIDDPDLHQIQPATAPYVQERTGLHQAGAFIQDQARFGGGWIATLNGRYDRIWVDGKYDALPGDTGKNIKLEKGRFSGRAGLGYEFENGLVPYVSIASTFNPLIGTNNVIDPVTFQIIDRSPFKPETGIQYEAGVKWGPTWFPGVFTASVFDLKKKNVISGPFNAQTQVGEVRSRGVELEAQANLTENWKLLAAFTAYQLKILDDDNPLNIGEQPFLVPEVIGSAFLDYTFTTGSLKGLSLGGGVRYIGKSEASQPNTLVLPGGTVVHPTVPSATLFDAAVRYKWNDNWKVSLNVTNLLDKRFVSGCQGINVCSFGEGRRALVKASYTW